MGVVPWSLYNGSGTTMKQVLGKLKSDRFGSGSGKGELVGRVSGTRVTTPYQNVE